jgi:hypothetical protein
LIFEVFGGFSLWQKLLLYEQKIFYLLNDKKNIVAYMSIKSKNLRWKKVICEDLTVGEVKEIIIDLSNWKASHLEVELTKEAAELAFGTRKGGIRNFIGVSAIGKVNKTIELKVKKGQLKIYLKPARL